MINKGRKFFTILLVVIAIVTVVLVIYLAYNYISNYFISKEAASAVDEFESQVANIIKAEAVNGETDENQQGGNSASAGTSTPNKVTYRNYNVIGTIQIPKTKVKYPIVESNSSSAMDVAIVMLYGPGLNKEGNTIVAGHNYRNGGFFGNNKKLENGDKIYITDTTGMKVEYTIYNKYITSDADFSYATRDTNGKREISLSTCTNNNSERLVIWAKEN